VVQHRLGHAHGDAEPRHAGCRGPPQIVERPVRDLHRLAAFLGRDLAIAVGDVRPPFEAADGVSPVVVKMNPALPSIRSTPPERRARLRQAARHARGRSSSCRRQVPHVAVISRLGHPATSPSRWPVSSSTCAERPPREARRPLLPPEPADFVVVENAVAASLLRHGA
jgi:hypothetical protein